MPLRLAKYQSYGRKSFTTAGSYVMIQGIIIQLRFAMFNPATINAYSYYFSYAYYSVVSSLMAV